MEGVIPPLFLLKTRENIMVSTEVMEQFYNAYNWLEDHPVLNKFEIRHGNFVHSLLIEVVKVNPDTNEIDDNDSLNTKVNIWLEAGSPVCHGAGVWGWTHDLNWDCGGETFEEAIIELQKKVEKDFPWSRE